MESRQSASPLASPLPGTEGVSSAAWKISIAIAISRILGLVREMVQARYFGAGMHTDAFYVAYRIPNLLRDLFAEGALSAAFLPTFIRRLTQDGQESAWLLANRLINALLLILALVTLALFLGAKAFVFLQAASYAAIPGKMELTVQMTRILSPFLMCVSLAAVFMGMLNACGSFFLPAMASSAFNICCILGGIFLSPYMPRFGMDPIVSMAIGALVGGISQFAVMIPSARALGFRYRWTLDFSDPGLRKIGSLMLPAILGLSATQINITVDNQLAAFYGNGPVSWLSYAFRLMQLPIGVFGIAIATVSMATVAHHAAGKEMGLLHRTVDSSLRLAACLTFPATIGLAVFRNEIVQLLFEREHFLHSDTLKTGQVVLCYSFALFAYAAIKVLVPTFYALNDTKTPLRMTLATVAFKIVLNLLLIRPFGFLGLAISTTASSWLNYILLWRSFRKIRGRSVGGKSPTAYPRIALASIAVGAIAWLIYHGCALLFTGSDAVTLGIKLGFAILGAIASLLPMLRWLGVEESQEVGNMIGAILGKRR